MDIRLAEEKDISAIVALLKISLGEGLMPKSEAYWRWKHVENPFGASPVLVAEDTGLLVGVRAFMRWQWTDGQRVYKAVRAVDTATHPKFQGKGIFKKLTMGLIDSCKREGVDFVFNTPNSQSRPGYLKMGWQDAGRMPVRFRVVNPLRRLFVKQRESLLARDWLSHNPQHPILNAGYPTSSIHSNYSPQYFHWRYGTVPAAVYNVLHNANNTVFYRLKENSLGLELRVTDWLTTGKDITSLQSEVLEVAADHGARIITFSGLLGSGGIVLQKGPRVTIRNLSTDIFNELHQFKHWSPSLGDMELF